jgi:hypothetical protein
LAEETYRAIIDELVAHAPSVAARRIREGAGLAPAHGAMNGLVGRLSPEDREVLAAFLDSERLGGIHDTLATLTWWLECGGVAWAHEGVPMAAGYEGGLHMDLIGRVHGWEWPAKPG